MQFDDFITRVQEQARLDTREESIRITRAVLETLGERLDRKVRNGLEAQLPNELKDFLLARVEHSDQYDLQEFYNRVGARADLTAREATERTKQVVAVLREAVPGGEIEDILEDLSPEYGELFA
ncbi:MAG TPA: DUF2267 domain-containing protein [Anaerolineales bacterium]|nr:DUF2267 domain-containing protein [Anaerolineales bacterium]